MAIVTVEGLDVEYRQDGAGPDLLLLHSLLTELTVIDEILPALTRTHRATLIDLPGVGASSPAGHCPMQEQPALLVELIEGFAGTRPR